MRLMPYTSRLQDKEGRGCSEVGAQQSRRLRRHHCPPAAQFCGKTLVKNGNSYLYHMVGYQTLGREAHS